MKSYGSYLMTAYRNFTRKSGITVIKKTEIKINVYAVRIERKSGKPLMKNPEKICSLHA